MATGWQKSYARNVRMAQRDMERFLGEETDRECRLRNLKASESSGVAYFCATPNVNPNGMPCGYWEAQYIKWNDGIPYCPTCNNTPLLIVRIFASCPRCGQEHNISSVATHCNASSNGINRRAARELCFECAKSNYRIPKRYREKGASIPVRIIPTERSNL